MALSGLPYNLSQGPVAQGSEQRTHNASVAGSSPAGPTDSPKPGFKAGSGTEFRARCPSIGYPRRFVAADLIISNARIFAGGRSIDGALAIEAGRIVSFGDMDKVRGNISQRTESIDAGGGLVTPGFIDAHVHPLSGGLKLANCSLEGAADLDEGLGMVASYAAKYPDREWIWGGGWNMAWFEHGNPSATALDRVVRGPAGVSLQPGRSLGLAQYQSAGFGEDQLEHGRPR